jgi:hypothetical protein
MHTDERVELKDNFNILLEKEGWFTYIKKVTKIEKNMNLLFKSFYIIYICIIIGLGVYVMRDEMPKVFGWISLFLIFVWIVIEQLNVKQINKFLILPQQKKLIASLKKNSEFIKIINLFEKLDMVQDNTVINLSKVLKINDYNKVIERIERIIYQLEAVKILKENAPIPDELLVNYEDLKCNEVNK